MAPYRVAPGHDVVLSSLLFIVPEPKGNIVGSVDRKYSLSGANYDQGLFAVYHWDYFETEAEYQTALEFFDLVDQDYAPVTIYTRNKHFVFVRFNGIAHLPEFISDAKWDNFFIRDVNLYVTHLEELPGI